MAKEEGLLHRLHTEYPFIEAEMKWGLDYELVEHVDDFLYRRIRLGFLDLEAVDSVRDKVVAYFGKEKKWDNARITEELKRLDQLKEIVQ